MTLESKTNAGPVEASARIGELDVLRGVALLGVLIGNFSEYILFGFIATDDQLAALPTAGIDQAFEYVILLFVSGKANSLFAFLFGVGFAMQMDRLSRNRADFGLVYSRRLLVLTIFGFIQLFFFFFWEVLSVYGLLGFALLAMRNVPNRVLIVCGFTLALFGSYLADEVLDALNVWEWASSDIYYEDNIILYRQELADQGNYSAMVFHMWGFLSRDWLLSGAVGYAVYAFGRFLLGAWVGRMGWLFNPGAHLAGFRRWLWRTLPLGLSIQAFLLFTWTLDDDSILSPDNWGFLAYFLDELSIVLIATGYVCAIVLGVQRGMFSRLLKLLAPVGRMALTNYVCGGVIMTAAYHGFVGGFNLAGEVGLTAVTILAIAIFAAQTVFSTLWLKHFAFGPLEWAWRVLTYGRLFPITRNLATAKVAA